MWTSFHAQSVNLIFDALNKEKLNFVVIGDYEALPDQNNAKDIDLVVSKKQINEVINLIKYVMKLQGFKYYEHTRFEPIWCYTFYALRDDVTISIKIDILYAFVWRGAVVVDFSEMLSNSTFHNGFRIQNLILNGFLLWIKPLLTGGYIKEKYRAAVLNAIEKSPEGFQAFLVRKFGPSLSERVWPLLQSGKLDDTVYFQSSLRHSVWVNSFKQKPIRTTHSTAEHIYRESLRRLKRSAGSMFAVVGPDGVGKTTFINLLEQELARILVRDQGAVIVQHFRPSIFPNIKKLLSNKKYDATQEEFTNPHRAKSANSFSSLARLIYYWLDYLLGYWLVIRRQCIRGQIYIFDRYFYDFIVDPRRSRINLPTWLRKVFLRLTPQPDLVFFLSCDSDTVFTRKQELSRIEIERQLGEYRRLVATFPRRFIILDAHQTPETSCREAIKQIIERSFHPL